MTAVELEVMRRRAMTSRVAVDAALESATLAREGLRGTPGAFGPIAALDGALADLRRAAGLVDVLLQRLPAKEGS